MAEAKLRRKITLSKMSHVRSELGRLYTEARNGDVAVADASRLANMLQILAKIIEGSELEHRLAEVEKALGERP